MVSQQQDSLVTKIRRAHIFQVLSGYCIQVYVPIFKKHNRYSSGVFDKSWQGNWTRVWLNICTTSKCSLILNWNKKRKIIQAILQFKIQFITFVYLHLSGLWYWIKENLNVLNVILNVSKTICWLNVYFMTCICGQCVDIYNIYTFWVHSEKLCFWHFPMVEILGKGSLLNFSCPWTEPC